MPNELHILLDPSGAYLCLDLNLVCSHLESLFVKIRVCLDRKDRLCPVTDEVKWKAFHDAPISITCGKQFPPYGYLPVVVRETKLNVILS